MSKNRILEAALFADQSHMGQTRRYTGRPYIEHPGRVAARATLALQDEDCTMVGWLHDVVEDCKVSLDTIGVLFGYRVYRLVDELTNPSKRFPNLSRADKKKMDREHLMGCSFPARIIKYIDRIDNLREIDNAPDDWAAMYKAESVLLADAMRGLKPDKQIEKFRDEIFQLCGYGKYATSNL